MKDIKKNTANYNIHTTQQNPSNEVVLIKIFGLSTTRANIKKRKVVYYCTQ